MIKITETNTFGFMGAMRGMRNPYMSHEKSDSYRRLIGNNDMTLARKLIKAGPEHRKFLRMIHVQADVLAPRYWWAEMDKYKYVEANSSSTMHLITKRELTIDDFSVDEGIAGFPIMDDIVDYLNECICEYNGNELSKEGKQKTFRIIKQLLPESYNQLRTIDTNYECLLSIYRQRKNHKLTEWKEFCMWIASLPYMSEFLEAVK